MASLKSHDSEPAPFPKGFVVRTTHDEYTKATASVTLDMSGLWWNVEGSPVATVTGPCTSLAEFEDRIDALMDQLSAARKEARAAFNR